MSEREPQIKIPGPIPTVAPLSSARAASVLQNCDVCWGMCPSDAFDFEHGMCNSCADALIRKESN